MSNKLKTLAISSAIILAASAATVVGTYALFTDNVKLTNHFVAGSMALTLNRTNLVYTKVDSEGVQKTENDPTRVPFTSATQDNVFGFTSNDKFIPTDYREATLELSNSSTVAYDYYLSIKLSSQSNALAEQLTLKVDTDSTTEGYEYTAKLSQGLDAGSVTTPLGMVKVGSTATFVVRVEFDNVSTNNNAQNLTVDFDLTVYASQHVASSN